MIVAKVIIEGLGLGLLICLYCAIGIRNGAIGLVHLYSSEVQKRTIELGMVTQADIQRREKILKGASAFTYLVYVLACVCIINGTQGFASEFLQIFGILEIANIIDRLVVDELWVGHSKAWIIPGTENLRPYITAADKKKKWAVGTIGFAIIAAIAAVVVWLIVG